MSFFLWVSLQRRWIGHDRCQGDAHWPVPSIQNSWHSAHRTESRIPGAAAQVSDRITDQPDVFRRLHDGRRIRERNSVRQRSSDADKPAIRRSAPAPATGARTSAPMTSKGASNGRAAQSAADRNKNIDHCACPIEPQLVNFRPFLTRRLSRGRFSLTSSLSIVLIGLTKWRNATEGPKQPTAWPTGDNDAAQHQDVRKHISNKCSPVSTGALHCRGLLPAPEPFTGMMGLFDVRAAAMAGASAHEKESAPFRASHLIPKCH